MKISLAFQIHNKECWLESLLKSWVDNLSGKHPIEYLIVFDGCKDQSKVIADRFFKLRCLTYISFDTNDIHEIMSDRLMADSCSGDVIVFVQDDNWIYDSNWDDILVSVFEMDSRCAVVGLLAGLQLNASPRLSYRRVEIDRPHKGNNFVSTIVTEPAIYQVDAINRPFATRMSVYKQLNGLDVSFCPHSYDDLDYSVRALKAGYTCLYAPFDLVNTSGCQQTIGKDRLQQTYSYGHRLCSERHSSFVSKRLSSLSKQGEVWFSV